MQTMQKLKKKSRSASGTDFCAHCLMFYIVSTFFLHFLLNLFAFVPFFIRLFISFCENIEEKTKEKCNKSKQNTHKPKETMQKDEKMQTKICTIS